MCCQFGALLGRWPDYWPIYVGEHIMNKKFIAKLKFISWIFIRFTYLIKARNMEHIEILYVQS
jgi:hypothetical protein